MFRAQSNAFDEAVVKATDENLTSENWEFILVWQPACSYSDMSCASRQPGASSPTAEPARITGTRIRDY